MSKTKALTCYACQLTPTTREHVPPLCLFPKHSETPGKDLRKNLITVPSCDLHNSKFSQHDEYLWALLLSCVRGRIENKSSSYPRLERALKRAESNLSDLIDNKSQSVKAIDHRGRTKKLLAVSPDMIMLDESFDKICRGLEYHKTGESYLGRVVLDYNFTYDPNVENNNTWRNIKFDHARFLTSDHPKSGSNPSIFYYQRRSIEDSEYTVYLLTFFEGIQVVAWLSPRHYENYRIPFFKGEEQQRFIASSVAHYEAHLLGKKYVFSNKKKSSKPPLRPILDDAPNTGLGMLSVVSAAQGLDRIALATELIERIETGTAHVLRSGFSLYGRFDWKDMLYGFIERDERGLVEKLTKAHRAKNPLIRLLIKFKYIIADKFRSRFPLLRRIILGNRKCD